MGLIRKKDRSEKRASQARTGHPPETSSAEESSKDSRPAPDASADTAAGDAPEPSFPTELRLAVEAVAAADTVAPGGSGSDAYGLRAELEASRRRGDDQPAEPKPETSEPAPLRDEPAPEDSMVAARPGQRGRRRARSRGRRPAEEPEATCRRGLPTPDEEPDRGIPDGGRYGGRDGRAGRYRGVGRNVRVRGPCPARGTGALDRREDGDPARPRRRACRPRGRARPNRRRAG